MSDKKYTYNVRLILEGDEEECLFRIVQEFGVSEIINLSFYNAGGFGNIGPFYQNDINNEQFDCVLCLYDVDYRYSEKNSPFNKVRNDLCSVVGDDSIVDAISFCTNPNILQILLLGCDALKNVALRTSSKKNNTPMVNKYWDKIGRTKKNNRGQIVLNDYEAKRWQLKIIEDSFIYEEYSYDTLIINCASLSLDYTTQDKPGSNIYKLLKDLKDGDIDFFEAITKKTKADDCE